MALHPMDDNATHISVLAAAIMAAPAGAVIEFGAGHYSTPLIRALCPGREVVTYESKSEWAKLFEPTSNPMHSVVIPNGWPNAVLPEGHIAVALVDSQPPHERPNLVRRCVDASYVLCHDSQSHKFGYNAVFDLFRYRKDYKRYSPWTTVLSNTVEDIDLCPFME